MKNGLRHEEEGARGLWRGRYEIQETGFTILQRIAWRTLGCSRPREVWLDREGKMGGTPDRASLETGARSIITILSYFGIQFDLSCFTSHVEHQEHCFWFDWEKQDSIGVVPGPAMICFKPCIVSNKSYFGHIFCKI